MTGPSEPIILQSNRLRVEIAQPGSFEHVTRFDWTMFTTQVTLDGLHTFCVPESYTPGQGTGGVGLCNEFATDMPLGYEEARPGESFSKPGIGLLRRPDEAPYSVFRPYEIVARFPIQIEATPERVRFQVEPLDCRGLSLRLIKTAAVNENILEIAYQVENTGSRVIDMSEYAHNFIGLDRLPVGPAVRVEFAQPVLFEDTRRAMRGNLPSWGRLLPNFVKDWLIGSKIKALTQDLDIHGRTMHLRRVPEQFFFCRLQNLQRMETPQWKMTHQNGMSISETDDFAPLRLAVWGTSHVWSVEVFAGIHLEAGQTQSWKRRYEFSATQPAAGLLPK